MRNPFSIVLVQSVLDEQPFLKSLFLILLVYFYLRLPLNMRAPITFNTINNLRIVNYNSTNNQPLCLENSV